MIFRVSRSNKHSNQGHGFIVPLPNVDGDNGDEDRSPLQCLHNPTNTRQINKRFNPNQPTEQSEEKGTINGKERNERENEKETEMRNRGKGTIQITRSDTTTG